MLAVAARERNRIARANALPEEVKMDSITAKIKPAKPAFVIRIESSLGERLQVSIYRLFGRVRTSDGQSARQFCRGLEQLLTKSTL